MSPVRLRRFLLSWLLLVPSCLLAEAGRPNILLLLADDLGYGELVSYGQPVITMPVLDELAGRRNIAAKIPGPVTECWRGWRSNTRTLRGLCHVPIEPVSSTIGPPDEN